MYEHSTDAMGFRTSAGERARIDSSGRLLVSSGDLRVTGTEGVSASLYLIADEGDDNGDGWRLNSNQDDNDLTISNNTTGSYVDQVGILTNGNFRFNSGYGSVATAYGVRAWVNFNGEGAVAIRGSGNVSSITDNGLGDYTLNFSNAMPDANYGVVTGLSDISNNADAGFLQAPYITTPSTSAFRFRTVDVNYSQHKDCEYVYLAFIR